MKTERQIQIESCIFCYESLLLKNGALLSPSLRAIFEITIKYLKELLENEAR